MDPQEQQLLLRLYKRFYFITIQKKYGYLKTNVKDKVQISGRELCNQLEVNPKVLRLSGIITSFSQDAMLNWLEFLRIMCLFLLRKQLIETRFEFILRFLALTSANQLDQADYI